MGAIKRAYTGAPRPFPVPIERIVDMLSAIAPALCSELLPKGTREGPHWVTGDIDGSPGRSCKIWIDGEKQGEWCDFASGEWGDMLDLIARRCTRGNKGEAVKLALERLGLDGRNPARLKATHEAVAKLEAKAVDAEADEKKHRGQAWHLFLSAQERILGTPVERYLDGRGIPLVDLGRQPGSLRYHPALWNTESGRKWSAMVAMIGDHEGHFLAVHRTWLEEHADGRVTKAPLKDAKMTLGRYMGGAIRVWRGASGKPLKDAPGGELVSVTEGLEDALTVALARPGDRVWCAVSLANIGNITLPASIDGVRIWAQNDAPGSKAAIALDKAAQKILARGKRVLIARPPAGVKDINDFLRGE